MCFIYKKLPIFKNDVPIYALASFVWGSSYFIFASICYWYSLILTNFMYFDLLPLINDKHLFHVPIGFCVSYSFKYLFKFNVSLWVWLIF